MVLRFWGARGVDAESFSHLVDERAGGISTAALLREIDERGWTAARVPGSETRLADEINRNGRPVLALIEDRPGTSTTSSWSARPSAASSFTTPRARPIG